jgi:hypothetical protein
MINTLLIAIIQSTGRRYLTILILLILGIILYIGLRWIEKRQRRSKLGDRPILSDDDIYLQFYAQSDIPKEVIIKTWHNIAEIVHVNPGILRPNDRLETLGDTIAKGAPSSYIEDIGIELTSRWHTKGTCNVNNIDDVVRFLCREQGYISLDIKNNRC